MNNKITVTSPLLPNLDEFNEMLKEIWASKWITNNGSFHKKLEAALAEYLKVPYVSLFTNGTLPLLTALQALRITGEVITTPYSFVATTHSIWWNGIKPVFVDIESYSQFNKGKAFCSNLVSTFCEMVKEAGYQPGWYTSRSFVGPYLTDKVAVGSGYTAWVAEHGRILHYDNIADIWQYSHTGRVNGIKTYVDLNWYFPNARTEDH